MSRKDEFGDLGELGGHQAVPTTRLDGVLALSFAAGFTALSVWAVTLFGFTWEQSALIYLLGWVVLWDRRYLANEMGKLRAKEGDVTK